jgi:hypothetical protein
MYEIKIDYEWLTGNKFGKSSDDLFQRINCVLFAWKNQ